VKARRGLQPGGMPGYYTRRGYRFGWGRTPRSLGPGLQVERHLAHGMIGPAAYAGGRILVRPDTLAGPTSLSRGRKALLGNTAATALVAGQITVAKRSAAAPLENQGGVGWSHPGRDGAGEREWPKSPEGVREGPNSTHWPSLPTGVATAATHWAAVVCNAYKATLWLNR
jgi:hypothetical protein